MTDLELLDAWRDGDRGAGSKLFERYFAGLFCFFRNKVGDAADDLVQQTFLALVESRDRFRGEASLRAYIFIIARSRMYNFIEKESRRKHADIDALSVQDLGLSPSGDLGRNEQQRILLHALRRLPLELQVTLELYYFEQIRGPELALVLGVPEGTVRSRMRRGRDLLREQLLALAESPEGVETTMTNLDDWARQLREAVPTAASDDT